MNRGRLSLLSACAVSLIASVGCSGPGTIRAEAVDSHWRQVLDRHDEYVRNDPTIPDESAEEAIKLRSSQIIRAELDAAKGVDAGE